MGTIYTRSRRRFPNKRLAALDVRQKTGLRIKKLRPDHTKEQWRWRIKRT